MTQMTWMKKVGPADARKDVHPTGERPLRSKPLLIRAIRGFHSRFYDDYSTPVPPLRCEIPLLAIFTPVDQAAIAIKSQGFLSKLRLLDYRGGVVEQINRAFTIRTGIERVHMDLVHLLGGKRLSLVHLVVWLPSNLPLDQAAVSEAARPRTPLKRRRRNAPGTALVQNLKNAEYCQTVYNGVSAESLATRFAEVDPRHPRDLLKVWRRDRLSTRIPRKFESVVNLPERLRPFIAAASEELSK